MIRLSRNTEFIYSGKKIIIAKLWVCGHRDKGCKLEVYQNKGDEDIFALVIETCYGIPTPFVEDTTFSYDVFEILNQMKSYAHILAYNLRQDPDHKDYVLKPSQWEYVGTCVHK